MSMIQSQSQKDLAHVAARVATIKGEPWAKIYGGLCHSFPVLVRTAGLAQTIAFHESKAGNDSKEGEEGRKGAHARLLTDVKALLPGLDVGQVSLSEYMRATRRVLAVWVFYKRFAVSVLKTEADSGNITNP
jgi:CRISPR-associated protein Cmr5